jgi:hypothetical protein
VKLDVIKRNDGKANKHSGLTCLGVADLIRLEPHER